MRLKDTPTGYGLISIVLHWLTAIVIVVLLAVGASIKTGNQHQYEQMLPLHTSIALTAYVLIWGRIIWRFTVGHPGPLPKQRGVFFYIGKYSHYVLLVAIGVMLISGPLMAWSAGIDIPFYDWFTIPAPFAPNQDWFDFLLTVHGSAASVIAIGVFLHIGGVFKHLIINRDGTFEKMMIPAHEPVLELPQEDLPAPTDAPSLGG